MQVDWAVSYDREVKTLIVERAIQMVVDEQLVFNAWRAWQPVEIARLDRRDVPAWCQSS
jgi:hypothetical protein